MEEKDFLKNFEKRMQSVGRYSVLCSNSFDKKIWKECNYSEGAIRKMPDIHNG